MRWHILTCFQSLGDEPLNVKSKKEVLLKAKPIFKILNLYLW